MTTFDPPRPENRIAFVLSGGGSLGAVEVGMLQALAHQGIAPDLVVGTSAGAVNAAWIAGRPGPDGADQLAEVWRSVRRRDVFPLNPWVQLRGFFGRSDHVVDARKLRRLLALHLVFERLEQAPVPIRVVATDITSGLEVILRDGPAVDAVAASAAIPGVFPTVSVAGLHLVDGGVCDNTPIAQAVEWGATTVYVLPTGYACSLAEPPRAAVGAAVQAITLLLQQRLQNDVARYQAEVDLRVVPPLCPLGVSPVDFSHSVELMDRARESTTRWLAKGQYEPDPAGALQIHRH